MRVWGLFPLLLLISWGNCWAESWEPIYHRNELVEEVLYDNSGRPLRQKIYTKGQLDWEKTYVYELGVITISTVDPSGENSSVEDILYLREDGSLWRMKRTSTSQSMAWSEGSTWMNSPYDSEITTFNNHGSPLTRTIFLEGEMVEEVSFAYGVEEQLISKERESFTLKEREFLIYNEQGRPIEYSHYKNALLVHQTFYIYNGQGYLSEKIDLGEGSSQSWTGSYDSSGSLQTELFYENDLISRKVTHRGEERTEEIYGRGKAILRVIYKGAEIISEEKID